MKRNIRVWIVAAVVTLVMAWGLMGIDAYAANKILTLNIDIDVLTAPNSGAEVLATFKKGDPVFVTGFQEGYYVVLYQGQTGYFATSASMAKANILFEENENDAEYTELDELIDSDDTFEEDEADQTGLIEELDKEFESGAEAAEFMVLEEEARERAKYNSIIWGVIIAGLIAAIIGLGIYNHRKSNKKMKYKAIIFDMDGTLLPMDMNEFTKGYFQFLAEKLSGFGIEANKLIAAVWKGVSAMVANDGSITNEKAFWVSFEQSTGVSVEVIGDTCLDFYSNEFHKAKMFTKENPLAKKAVKLAHKKAPIVALATNPLFPMCGQDTRMSWIGLASKDFDLVTSYESDSFCKPNPKYFLSVCERLRVKPKDCLMIGNDEYEDMYSASQVGMDCYLVTDTCIRSEKHPWEGPKGSFEELIEMLRAL